MNFYTHPHKQYCGIDLHARSMYVCILDQSGTSLVHKHRHATPDDFLRVSAPYREELVVAVECLFTWYGLADRCAQEGSAFVLGHALSMQALQGGKAKNDKLAAPKIAVLLRGGMFPQASVYPPALRATRDLRRRRGHLMRKRAEVVAHIQNTNRPSNLPEFGKRLAYKAHREGVAEHCPDPRVRQSMEVDVAVIDHYDQVLGEGELYLPRPAKGHDVQPFSRLQSVPGIGQLLALVSLSELQDMARVPRVQDFLSSGRLGKCLKDSAGKRVGSSGKKIGTPQLQWAFSEAAVRFWRPNKLGQDYFAKLDRKHGKGQARTVLAQKLARAVSYLRTRPHAVDLPRVVAASPLRGTGEPAASLAPHGQRPTDAHSLCAAPTACAHRGTTPGSPTR